MLRREPHRSLNASRSFASLGLLVAIATISCVGSQTTLAGKHNRVLDVGSEAPAWKELKGIDGNDYDLEKLSNAKAVVMIFTCNHCPVAQAYEQRVVELAEEAKEKGVVVVAINANKGEAIEAMKQHSDQRGLSFPYLRDESQETARAYGATCTPHAFLIDQDRKIAYMGAIDDSWQNADEVKSDYLRDAINAVLDGKQPETKETKQVGCAIRWRG